MSAELYKGGDFNEAVQQCPYLNQLGETALQSVKDTYAALETIDFDSIDFDAELAELTETEMVTVSAKGTKQAREKVVEGAVVSSETEQITTITADAVLDDVRVRVDEADAKVDEYSKAVAEAPEEPDKLADIIRFAEPDIARSMAVQRQVETALKTPDARINEAMAVLPVLTGSVTDNKVKSFAAPSELPSIRLNDSDEQQPVKHPSEVVRTAYGVKREASRYDVTIEDVLGVSAPPEASEVPVHATDEIRSDCIEITAGDSLRAILDDEPLRDEAGERSAVETEIQADMIDQAPAESLKVQLERYVEQEVAPQDAADVFDQIRELYDLATVVYADGPAPESDETAHTMLDVDPISQAIPDALSDTNHSLEIVAISSEQVLEKAVVRMLTTLSRKAPQPDQVERFIALLRVDVVDYKAVQSRPWIDKGGKEEKHGAAFGHPLHALQDMLHHRFRRVGRSPVRHMFALAG